jgi:hypothetical protein
MLNLQTLRQNADSCNLESGQSFEDEQGLVLMRLNPGFTRGALAEIHEPANLVAKLRKHTIVILSHSCFVTRNIISHYDIIFTRSASRWCVADSKAWSGLYSIKNEEYERVSFNGKDQQKCSSVSE